ncbi:hypothetical protein [Pseudoalteromonas agarivorans]|uniref:hypothetical protein n=1 Tax=Pseudoalteromonas agarivorans TaxID=176102 RepID=UPI00249C396F|nr:hypothetical protein [Pseudoalteromonas agarivorans]MDI3247397.1 hypothetical protein [Pseudoalteromonas agarivorans]
MTESRHPTKQQHPKPYYIYNAQPIMSDDAFGLSNLHDWFKYVGWLSDGVTPPNKATSPQAVLHL